MTLRRQAMGALAAIVMVLSAVVPAVPAALAQDGTVTVVARGLTMPGGFTWNANDVLFVALAGSGGGEICNPKRLPRPTADRG